MTRKGYILGLLVLLALASALGYTAWRMRSPAVANCDVCMRPLHERSKATGLVEGRKLTFCCPACALTADRQMKGGVKILQLTDYAADIPLKPEDAFIVTGSDMNHCVHPRVLFDREKQPSSMDFDRCSPSMIAFASREDAEAFARAHGGAIAPFAEIAAANHK